MMKDCGVSLDNDTMQYLLCFLTLTRANNRMLLKLFDRIARDDTYNLTFVECYSLTKFLILSRISNYVPNFGFSSPSFLQNNYLVVHFDFMSEVSSLSLDCLILFSHALCSDGAELLGHYSDGQAVHSTL